MLSIMGILARLTILGGDDEKEYKPFGLRMFLNIFNRFQGDVFFIYKFDNWEYLMDNTIPSVALAGGMAHFLFDFFYWVGTLFNPSLKVKANYQKDTFFAKQGMPKFMIDATYFLPGGSTMRFLDKRGKIYVKKHNMLDMKEIGFSKEVIDELKLPGNKISEFDIEEYAYKWKRMYRDIKLSSEYEALKNKGIDPSIYLDLKTGESLLKAENDEYMQAIKMMILDQMIDAGELDSDLKTIKSNVKEMRKLENTKKPVIKKAQRRKFDEAMQKYNK